MPEQLNDTTLAVAVGIIIYLFREGLVELRVRKNGNGSWCKELLSVQKDILGIQKELMKEEEAAHRDIRAGLKRSEDKMNDIHRDVLHRE